ncbi:phosphatase PAP2 family protein [Caulobacter soli]|uniref:phosphatase PAP2 family protein n=1 Tax=Caulobacter soli TaxID=2708539 RepID=UPI0013ED37D3|nr:phosphatase PAP2 family protein [Caulobacter soli]
MIPLLLPCQVGVGLCLLTAAGLASAVFYRQRHDPAKGAAAWAVWSLAGALVLVATILVLAIGVLTHGSIINADASTSRVLFTHRSPWLDRLMIALSAMGDGSERTTATVLIVAFLLWCRRWRAGLGLALVMTASAILVPSLKTAFHFARPSLLYSGADAFSFPSGHATSAMALFVMLAFITGRGASAGVRWLIAGLAALIITLTGLSRIYVGAHWLSDVLAAFALGGALALTGIALAARETSDAARSWHGGVVLTILILVAAVLLPRAYSKGERLYGPYLARSVGRVVDPGRLGGPGGPIMSPPGG